ncbi:MAG: hypothetical protein MUO22_08645 [Sedimentisphaerales bacterium]|jgi:hypothetical protein|nr:hypothetical protein [Sedimentisphaerales bacterium]
MTKVQKKKRADSQLSGMAGEFLVAGKLFKRGLQVSITMGNAKSIDLFVHNPKTDHTFNVQVKTLKSKNYFPIRKENIKANDIYVFVILNRDEQDESFFILKGQTILNNIDHFFGSSYKKAKSFPAINYGPLKEHKDNWAVFD